MRLFIFLCLLCVFSMQALTLQQADRLERAFFNVGLYNPEDPDCYDQDRAQKILDQLKKGGFAGKARQLKDKQLASLKRVVCSRNASTQQRSGWQDDEQSQYAHAALLEFEQENQQLHIRNRTLSDQLRSAQEQLRSQRFSFESFQNLQQEHEALKQQLQQQSGVNAHELVTRLQDEQRQLREQMNLFANRENELQKKYQDLEKRFQEQIACNGQLVSRQQGFAAREHILQQQLQEEKNKQESLRAQMQNLNAHHVQDLQQLRNDFEAQKQQLEHENMVLKQKFSQQLDQWQQDHLKTVSAHKQELQQLRTEKSHLERTKNSERAVLQHEIEACKQKIIQLQQQQNVKNNDQKLQQELQNLRSENDQLKNQLAQQRATIARLEQADKEFENLHTISQLRQELQNLQNVCKNKSDELNGIKQVHREQLKQMFKQLKDQKDELEEQHQHALQKRNQALQDLSKKSLEQQRGLQEQELLAQKTQQQLNSLNKRLQELQKENEQLRSGGSESQKMGVLKSERDRLQQQIQNIAQERDALELHISGLEFQVMQLRSQKDEAEQRAAQFEHVKKEYAQFKKQHQELQDRIKQLEAVQKDPSDREKELEQTLKELEMQYKALQNKLQEEQKNKEHEFEQALQDLQHHYQRQFETLQSDYRQKEASRGLALQQAQEEVQQQIHELIKLQKVQIQKKTKDLNDQIAKLKQENTQLRSQSAQAQRAQSLQNENKQLQEQLVQKHQAYEKLQRQRLDLKKIVDLKGHNAALEKQLEEQKNRAQKLQDKLGMFEYYKNQEIKKREDEIKLLRKQRKKDMFGGGIDLQNKVLELENRLQAYQGIDHALQQKSQEVKNLHRQLFRQEQKTRDLENQLKKMEQLDALEAELHRLATENTSLRGQLQKKEDIVSGLTTKLERYWQDNRMLQQEVEGLKKGLDARECIHRPSAPPADLFDDQNLQTSDLSPQEESAELERLSDEMLTELGQQQSQQGAALSRGSAMQTSPHEVQKDGHDEGAQSQPGEQQSEQGWWGSLKNAARAVPQPSSEGVSKLLGSMFR